MNKVKIAVLFSCVVLALGGCTRIMKGPGIVTLEQAMEVQKTDAEKAIVFATVEDAREEKAAMDAVAGFFMGDRSSKAAISFAGSPYDVKSESLKKLREMSAKLNEKKGEDARIIALSGFAISEQKNWALIYPAKYAVEKMQSADAHVADMRGWGRQDGKAYMVFDVNPGEVVYLGHIRTNWNNGQNIGVTVEDRFETFRATLPAQLQGKVQKRLIKAPSHILAEELTELPRQGATYIPIYTYR